MVAPDLDPRQAIAVLKQQALQSKADTLLAAME
jgi:hypothetical protein